MSLLYAKSGPEWTTLEDHLTHVSLAVTAFAQYLDIDKEIALHGAILHDIGKVQPVFQKRLKERGRSSNVFRHEIASLFFISAFAENHYAALIEMVVGHHKSVENDSGDKGLLDLENGYDYIDFHLGKWEEWSPVAFGLLAQMGISAKPISREEALTNLDYVIKFCKNKTKEKGYSEWRGLLMGADHFASALIAKTESEITRTFKKPNLEFFNRQHHLYPLSLKDTNSEKKHTIALACTGAGKTDYLFKRCKGRVFYTLPFQASINAMFKRVSNDLEKTNPDLDIRVLHSASTVVKRKLGEEDSVLQPLFGSAIKILTPHQLAAIAFGLKGFEALILDLKGCDIILDEIHTYSGTSQAIVLKLVEILKYLGCSIHIGTATMPSILYNKIMDLLGEDVLQVSLSVDELNLFNRHRVQKLASFANSNFIIKDAVLKNEKVLIVFNTVEKAQNAYKELKESYPDTPILLLHSRFKRGDRNEKERQLMGLNSNGESTGEFNTSNNACIVVSTQIVEVSLDISFDLLITEAAPLDALIQRFGRINRKRWEANIGNLKKVYVTAPPDNGKEARPYDLAVLEKSYEVLRDGEVLLESELQEKIDKVFTKIDFLNIEEHAVFKKDGKIVIDKLTHRKKSILFDVLEIDSVSCICEADEHEYEKSDFEGRLLLEIPVRYFEVFKMRQSQKGNKPFLIPDLAYTTENGLDKKKINVVDFNKQLI